METAWALSQLRTRVAAGTLSVFVVTYPNQDMAMKGFGLLLEMGKVGEESLFRDFVNFANSPQTLQAMRNVADYSTDRTFSTDVGIESMNTLLRGAISAAMQAVDLVYYFSERKGELVGALEKLEKMLQGGEWEVWRQMVVNALDYAKAK